MVPQTIASETAQKANWKNRNAAGEIAYTSRNGIWAAASAGVEPMSRKKPESPDSSPAPPNASAKPTAQ